MRSKLKLYEIRWQNLKFWSKSFLFFSGLNLVACVVIAVLHSVRSGAEGMLENLLHGFLLACGFVVQGVHCFLGILEGNHYELTMAHIIQIFITIIVVLVCFSIPIKEWPITHILLFCYGCIFQCIYFLCAIPLYQDFDVHPHPPSSSSPNQEKDENDVFLVKYKKHILFASLLKVDLLLSVVNIGIFDSEISNLNWLLIALASLFATALHYFTGWYGHQYEKSPVVITFWGLCTVIPALVSFGVYKLISTTHDLFDSLFKSEQGSVNFKLLFLCSSFLGLTIRFILLYQSTRLFKCFHQGRRVVDFVRDTNEDIISGSAVSHLSIHDVIINTLRVNKRKTDLHLSGQLPKGIIDPYSDVEDNKPLMDPWEGDKFEFQDEM